MKSTPINAIVALSLCAAALVGHGFWYAAVVDKSAEVANLQNRIDEKTEFAARTASARTTLAEVASDESVVRGYFVPEAGVVPFIDDLEARARAQTATMKVLSVSVANAVKQPTLSLSLTINGTFDAVMRTVGSIEYSPYNLSLAKFSLMKDEKDIWNANLELLVGSILANSSSTSTKAAIPKILSSSFTAYEYF